MTQSLLDFDITKNRHRGNAYSILAHKSLRQDKAKNEKHVLEAIRALGEASSEQVEDHLGWSHQSVSSRFSDLKRKNLIEQCGTTTTRSGAKAGLWRTKQ